MPLDQIPHNFMTARLEDIVVSTEAGPRSLNQADHRLVAVDA